MRGVLCLLVATLAAGPALAAGGLSCEAKDKAVKFSVESGVTHGMGGPVFNFRGTLEVLDKAVAKDLRKISFSQAELTQYWLDADDLRLLLYRERTGDKPHGYVSIEIKTKSVDEGSYRGRYGLTVFDTTEGSEGEGKMINHEGKVSCMAE
jgi:hypothetical protein